MSQLARRVCRTKINEKKTRRYVNSLKMQIDADSLTISVSSLELLNPKSVGCDIVSRSTTVQVSSHSYIAGTYAPSHTSWQTNHSIGAAVPVLRSRFGNRSAKTEHNQTSVPQLMWMGSKQGQPSSAFQNCAHWRAA